MRVYVAYVAIVSTWLALAWCSTATADILTVSQSSVSVTDANRSRVQIYPPEESAQGTDACPGASWKTWKLHRSPSTFEPLNWTRDEWRSYIVDYPLRSAGLSIAFLLLALVALAAALVWRLAQWCVGCSASCRRCCSVGAEDTAFLADSKHAYLKAWISLLLALGLAMVVWGMLALDEGLLAAFWGAARDAIDYGSGVAGGMRELQANLTTTLPAQLDRTVTLVNSFVDPDRLVSYAGAGLNFTTANRPLTDSLLSAAGSMLGGLQGSLLPGLAALAAQLGASLGGGAQGAGSRRLLASASSFTSPVDSLSALLPALSEGLPRIETANATLGAMQSALQALQSGLAPVASSASSSPPPPPPSPAELAALAAALNATRTAAWDDQLAQLLAGLQAFNASRSAGAFSAVASAVEQVVAGAAPLSPASASQLVASLRQLGSDFASGPQQALQSLLGALRNISANAVDVSAWNVTLQGPDGARTVTVSELVDQVLEYAQLLGGNDGAGSAAMTVLAPTTPAQGGRRRRRGLQQSGAPAFSPQELANVSSVVASLNASVASLASAALPAATLAALGPDPSAAAAAISSSLRPAAAAAAGPAAAVSLALSTYTSAATAANLAALRAAAAAAAAPVTAAVAAFAAGGLPDAAALAAAAHDLEGPVATLESAAAALNASLSSGATYSALQRGNATLAGVRRGLDLYTSLVDSLPDAATIEWTLRQAGDDVTDTVTRLADDVRRVAADAGSALGSAISSLQSDVLDIGQDLVSRHQDDTVRANRIAYAAWMGAWGLAAALLLLLLLAVWANWPAGLVAATLATLALVAASQVLCTVLAFGTSALADGCASAERLALQAVVQRTSDPKLSVVLSYYLYDTPGSQELALQASFGLNVSAVRAQVRSANATLVQQLYSRFGVQGQLRSQLASLEALGGAMYDGLERLLELALRERVHPLYDDAKGVVCCSAGGLAYNQWCAATAWAALTCAALVSAAYLLARLDLLAQRGPGCCSCCACACYTALDRRKLDEEAAEDAVAKEAQRQQLRRHQQVQQAAHHSAHNGNSHHHHHHNNNNSHDGQPASAAQQEPHVPASPAPQPLYYGPPAAAPPLGGLGVSAGGADTAAGAAAVAPAAVPGPYPAVWPASATLHYEAPSAPPMSK